MKKRILIFTNYYYPCVKGGGPIRSIKNLVDNLSDKIDFNIITGDRDLGDPEPFENITKDSWTQVDSAKVYYTDIKKLSLKKTINLINSINCEVIYLNSFFSYRFSISLILLSRLGLLSDKEIVLAPRGEFSTGALGLKSYKKKLYLALAKIFRFYDNVKWHATTKYEIEDIQKIFGIRRKIYLATNLTASYKHTEYSKSIKKNPGELILVYVSRIHPMKNLLQVLETIKTLDGNILFNIYGPVEDTQYWEKCNQIIKEMPGKIVVKYHGIIENEKLYELFKNQHYFILLTLGENFGHAIAEALMGGCPVIISDRTPWKNLENYRVGWDIPLEEKKQISRILQSIINQNDEDYQIMSRTAYEFCETKFNQNEVVNSYCEMLIQ